MAENTFCEQFQPKLRDGLVVQLLSSAVSPFPWEQMGSH